MEGHRPHQHQHQYQQQHLHHRHLQQQQQQTSSVNVDAGDRFPQWSMQETKAFLMIRAELDQNFMETKRNKRLWEVIANMMKEKGYYRRPEQCKCKWKNLVTRYKGCETIGPEAMIGQFPFYAELQAIFAARMQRMLWAEAESGSKRKMVSLSSDEEKENEESEGDQKGKKKKSKKNRGTSNNLREMLEDFMKQQIQMEMEWREAFEARENERRSREMEWRQIMAALENERMAMERSWREREEQRRIREEGRAEKRDALITVLLNKLRRDDL